MMWFRVGNTIFPVHNAIALNTLLKDHPTGTLYNGVNEVKGDRKAFMKRKVS